MSVAAVTRVFCVTVLAITCIGLRVYAWDVGGAGDVLVRSDCAGFRETVKLHRLTC